MKDELVNIRRKLHQCPDIGWLEFETTIFIIEFLKKLKISYLYGKEICGERFRPPSKKQVEEAATKNKDFYKEEYSEIFEGYTGVIAKIDTGKSGKHFLFRFDIDGLPVLESDNLQHLPNSKDFSSKNIGRMHACGHDGHTAIGLCLAKWLKNNLDALTGSYTIIFQPAEEGGGGASALAQKINFDSFDYFFGLHIGFGTPSGFIGVGTKDFYGLKHFNIDFFGKPSHSGNKPEEGHNALLTAASASLMLHSLPQYSSGIARINVGKLNSGTAGNVVPEYANMLVEIRSDNNEIMMSLEERLKTICINAASCYGTTANISTLAAFDGYNEVDEGFAKTISIILQTDGIKTFLYPSFKASEDVTEFMNRVHNAGGKSIHLMIGTELKDSHHSPNFDFEESCLEMALKGLIAIVKSLS